jgi:uncharacterized protein (DUF4415 family)
MQIKTKSGRWVHLPDVAEEVQINAGIAVDPDTFVSTDESFARAVPAKEFFAPEVYEALVAMKRTRGRPPLETPKVATAIRFDADVLVGLRATGKGWQTRVNDAMRQWLAQQSDPKNN